jgi:hypothetical protein
MLATDGAAGLAKARRTYDSAPLMNLIVCGRCGGKLRLSVSDAAYVCASDASHRYARLDAERRWLDDARARAEASPADVLAALALASVHGAIGTMTFAAGDAGRAQAFFQDELALLDALHAAHGSDERVTAALIDALGVQAQLADEGGQWGVCLATLEKMLPLAESLHQAHPEDDEWVRAMSLCHNGMGRMRRQLGDAASAARHFASDLRLISLLCERHPADASLSIERAIAHFNVYLAAVDPAEESEHLQAAIGIVDELERVGRADSTALEVRQRARSALASKPAAAPRRRDPVQDASSRSAEDRSTRRAWLVARVDEELRRRRA